MHQFAQDGADDCGSGSSVHGNVCIIVINLARRPDRLSAMREKLGRHGLAFTRVDAVDARTVAAERLYPFFASDGPLGALSVGDMCCSLSHRAAWETLLASHCEWGVILEDDVILADDFGQVLANAAALPAGVDLVKLERCSYSHRVLLKGAMPGPLGHTMHRLLSKHICAAGYLLRRNRVQELLKRTRNWAVPVDHFLFNPQLPFCGRAITPFQLVPATVEQEATSEGMQTNSDIKNWRRISRPMGVGLWRREMQRIYYQLRSWPARIRELVAGARYRDVPFGSVIGRSKLKAAVSPSASLRDSSPSNPAI